MAMFWLGFVLCRSPHVRRLNHSNGRENVRQSSPFRRRYCALYIVHLQAFSERQESVRYRPLRCSKPGSRAPRRAPQAHGRAALCPRRAGGAGGNGDALKIEGDDRRFRPSCPRPRIANNVVFGRRPAASPKVTACGEIALRPDSNRLRQHVRGLGGKMALRRRGCRPEGCDTDDIFGAVAQAALLAAAADQRLWEMDIFIRRIRAPTPTTTYFFCIPFLEPVPVNADCCAECEWEVHGAAGRVHPRNRRTHCWRRPSRAVSN
jgi:hypothetical protein